MAVVAGAADAGESTHSLHRERALRQRGRHRLDDRIDPLTPGPVLGWRGSLTCRKACRKKSSSTCCWPILRSSSATRRRAAASASSGPSGGAGIVAGAAAPLAARGGRPRPRKACGPPARKRSRQAYRSLRDSLSSRPKALTFSPATSRQTTPSLNSRLKTRGDLDLDMGPPMENCYQFPVSHFWGALQFFTASNTFWPSSRTPSTTSSEIDVAFLSSRTRTTVPSRIKRTIGSSASERLFHASQSPCTLRHTRLTVSLLTAPLNSATSARRTRRVLVPERYAPAISASAARVRR